MNKSIQLGTPRTWSHAYPLPVQNVAGENAPPYAVMQVYGSTATDSGTMYLVGKPTGSASGAYLFNTPEALAYSAYGSAAEGVGMVAIAGNPAVNQEVGPVNGSWAMSASGKGYLYLGGLVNGVGRVIKSPSGTDYPIVRILNNSGVTLPVGSICGFGTPYTFPPTVQTSVWTWYEVAPTANKPFCVLLSDIPTGTTGDAAPVGVVSCQINLTVATHEYAQPTSGDNVKLASATTGPARILWREKALIAGAGTLGVQWAIVALNQQPAASDDIRGVSYGTIPAATGSRDGALTPGVGAAKLYTMPTGAAGTAWAINTNPVVVENWMRGSIPSYKPLLLRPSRSDNAGTQIYTVVSEGCAEIPSG